MREADVSAHGKNTKLVPLTAALCLAAAAFGGYALASNHTAAGSPAAESLNLADATSGASSHDVTIYACLAAGRLTRMSVAAAPKCPVKSVPVQWTAQSGPAVTPKRRHNPAPSPSASPSPSSRQSSSPPAGTAPSTSPSASPTSTGQGTACVTSSNTGVCGPYDFAAITGSGGQSTFVIQDVWNAISGASQTLTSYSPGNWSVSAKMPASNTAVVSYPDTQHIYTTTSNTPNPLSGFSSVTSSYTENGPAGSGDDYEAAYDIWAGTGSDNGAQEIMIWVDNHGQRPAGSQVASATIDGVGYQIWSKSGAGTVGDPVSMVMDSNQSSGSVNILDDLNWLKSNGYMPAGSGLNQIDFGWEICSTGGTAQTFTMSQYAVTATCTSGSSCTS
jgi:hypothetical protein